MEEEEEGEASKLGQSGSSAAESGEAGTSSNSGRFYECIFCRRGFTTAQALGGHMNIHRRDRPRVRPPAASPKDSFHPYSRNPPPPPPFQILDPSSASNYIVYIPPPPSSPEPRPELLRAGEELHLGPTAPRQVENDLHDEEDLDLELRLGS